MDWVEILNNPAVLQSLIGLVVAAFTYLFNRLGVTVDPELIRSTCDEAISVFRNRAENLRDENGNIALPQAERLISEAIAHVRNRLKDKKPRWLPRFIWNWALSRISTHLIKTILEGALEVYKQRFR